MKTLELHQMEAIEGGGIIGKACSAYAVYAVGALILGGPVSAGAGAFCAGYLFAKNWL